MWTAAVLGSCISESVSPYVFHGPFATCKLFKWPDLHSWGSKHVQIKILIKIIEKEEGVFASVI